MHSLCCDVLELILGFVFRILGHYKDEGEEKEEM